MKDQSLEPPRQPNAVVDNYVTGANGFIGKHLMAKLSGNTVTIPHPDIKWTALSIREFRRFFFLSTFGNMAHHAHLYAQILRANVTDLGHVLLAAYGADFESFIYVSSSSVTLPVQTPYSRTKRAAEEMVLAMPIPGRVVRPYSVTGVGEQREHLIPTLIRSCMEGEPMDFVPDATHDFIDVSDVVSGLLSLADTKATGIVEFGKGVPISNNEVRIIIEQVCGKQANIRIVKKLRDYDDSDWCCKNLSASQEHIREPKTLRESIREMVAAYKNEHA